MIPYGRQIIDQDDIDAVCKVLQGDWLTTGPCVAQFEEAVAHYVGSTHAVAVSSGTAGLHAAMFAAGVQSGDEVIVSPMTFVASANAVVYQGAVPVFADVLPKTLLIDPEDVEAKITDRTKAIVAVDYAGQPCDYSRLRDICDRHGLTLIADACHAIGARYRNQPVGSLADLTTFSFHPVKHITTGEGGMVTTNDAHFAQRMQQFRNHGITTDYRHREATGQWAYEMQELGFNYRITDMQCALGMSQLKKLPAWIERRNEIARLYDQALLELPGIAPLHVANDLLHAYHLYVVRIDAQRFGMDRAELFQCMRQAGIGVNVHYMPVHLHPFYQNRFGYGPGMCPVAESAYETILSLPMYPGLSSEDLDHVVRYVTEPIHA